MQKDHPSGRVMHKILRDLLYIDDPEAIYLAALYPKKQSRYSIYHIKMLQKSADLGYVEAIRMLAEYYFSGDVFGVLEQDISKSMSYFKLAAEKGDPFSMKCYGLYLQKGWFGLEKNEVLGGQYIDSSKEFEEL